MDVISNPLTIFSQLDYLRREGKRIGIVPTMGALHEGHLSLVRHAKQACDISVATIFVNPSQFGPNEDYQRYPRTLESDLQALDSVGCDFVFTPTMEAIYPSGYSTYVEPPRVAERWEGAYRPGHFRGVATIVLKLFMLVPAQVAYFGRKDYQQVAVISAMVRDLGVPIRIEACETIRDPDGLAMSSRNRYLSESERVRALSLSHALHRAQMMLDAGHRSPSELEQGMRDVLLSAPVDSIDYAVVVDPETLDPIESIQRDAVALIAARVGTTRLIDNRTLVRRT
ncbi:MAG: pantoate--beta-alanine ligase [Pirellula sp.]|jgi:pantoate--beta-alanine ligase|nr:pantoate--beta-alanine ligase [Pirellula sp.]